MEITPTLVDWGFLCAITRVYLCNPRFCRQLFTSIYNITVSELEALNLNLELYKLGTFNLLSLSLNSVGWW